MKHSRQEKKKILPDIFQPFGARFGQVERLEMEMVKDQALKESLAEKSEGLEETRSELGRQQEKLQVRVRGTNPTPFLCIPFAI